MAAKDLLHNVAVVPLITPQTITDGGGDVVSPTTDLQGFDSNMIVVSCGQSGDAAPVFKVRVEHADDDGTGSAGAFSDVTASEMLQVTGMTAGVIDDANGTFNAGTGGQDISSGTGAARLYRTQYIGEKRFIRVTIDEDGTNTNGTVFSAVLVKGYPAEMPNSTFI